MAEACDWCCFREVSVRGENGGVLRGVRGMCNALQAPLQGCEVSAPRDVFTVWLIVAQLFDVAFGPLYSLWWCLAWSIACCCRLRRPF